jgi:hypothetical protein
MSRLYSTTLACVIALAACTADHRAADGSSAAVTAGSPPVASSPPPASAPAAPAVADDTAVKDFMGSISPTPDSTIVASGVPGISSWETYDSSGRGLWILGRDDQHHVKSVLGVEIVNADGRSSIARAYDGESSDVKLAAADLFDAYVADAKRAGGDIHPQANPIVVQRTQLVQQYCQNLDSIAAGYRATQLWPTEAPVASGTYCADRSLTAVTVWCGDGNSVPMIKYRDSDFHEYWVCTPG